MTKDFFKNILRLQQTIFTFKELTLLWPKSEPQNIKSRLNYYIRQGELYPIRRGLYAKDKNYDRFEVATKIYTPSYISFETVLKSAGIIFQHYEQIFVATYRSRTIECDAQIYTFRKIKAAILTNPLGIDIQENYSIATPERAFLDTLYLHKDYHFDNLGPLDWNKIFEILPIYKNQRMEKIVNKYHKEIGGK